MRYLTVLCLAALLSGCALLDQMTQDDSSAPAPVAATPAATNPLACKLLKASAYAYQVNSTGAISDPTLATLMGGAGEGYGVISGGHGQTDTDRDAAYVWHDDKEVIIAFRGTLPYASDGSQDQQALSLQDWLNDADYRAQPDPDLGVVHRGFETSFYNLWPGLLTQIKAWQAAGKIGPDVGVYVTGHSKGGALAMLAALKLRADKVLPVTEVDTFGAPRTGGQDFAARYATAGIDGIRYENQDDVVPHVPLNAQELALLPLLQQVLDVAGNQKSDYVSVGKLHYLTADGGIETPADPQAEAQLDTTRLADFARMALTAPGDVMPTITAAHLLGDLSPHDDSRYFQAVCATPAKP